MMNMGVPFDLYWFGDPFAVRHYIKAYDLGRQEQIDLIDYTAWLHGAYVHEAVSVSIGRSLDKSFRGKYPMHPHTIVERERKRKQKHEDAVMAAFAEFSALATVYNAKRRQLQDGGVDTDPAS